MRRFVLIRLLSLIPISFGVAVVVFVSLRLVPGDIVGLMLGEMGNKTAAEALRQQLGLDRPAWMQFVQWVGGLPTGDLGVSLRTGQPVAAQILARLPVTLHLTLFAMLLAVALSVPLGVASAVRRNSFLDLFLRMLSFMGLSTPNFWLAILFTYLFSLQLGWLPSGGYVPLLQDPVRSLQGTLLPALALALPSAAVLMRFTRTAMLEVLAQDYMRTARAKGLAEWIVLYRHGLRNGLINIVTVLGVQLGYMVGGAIVIETIFRWNGMGYLTFQAITNRDYTLAQSTSLFTALLVVVVMLVVDLLYAFIDPRIRYD